MFANVRVPVKARDCQSLHCWNSESGCKCVCLRQHPKRGAGFYKDRTKRADTHASIFLETGGKELNKAGLSVKEPHYKKTSVMYQWLKNHEMRFPTHLTSVI